MGLGKEARIGFVVIGVLLLALSVVLTLRLMTTRDRPLASFGRSENIAKAVDGPEALAGATVVAASAPVKSPTCAGWSATGGSQSKAPHVDPVAAPSYMPNPHLARSDKTITADGFAVDSTRVTSAALSSGASNNGYLRLASDTAPATAAAASPKATVAATVAPMLNPSATLMPVASMPAAGSATAGSSVAAGSSNFSPSPGFMAPPLPLSSGLAAPPASPPIFAAPPAATPATSSAASATMGAAPSGAYPPIGYPPSNNAPTSHPPTDDYGPARSSYPSFSNPAAPLSAGAVGTAAAANPMATAQSPTVTPRYDDATARSIDGRSVRPHYSSEPQRNADGSYKVMPGDNYWTICERVYGTGAYFKALAEHNRGKGPRDDRLQPGATIQTPSLAELARDYPDLCPKPSHQRPVGAQFATVSTALPSGGRRLYRVSEGDTLFEIARHELGTPARWAEIYQLNRNRLGDDYDYLTPGMELVLPGGEPPAAKLTERPTGGYQR